MKFPSPEHGSAKVRTAGNVLAERVSTSSELTLEMAYDIAGNWRSSFGFPLQVIGMTLRRRARKIDPKFLYAQRLKRMPSIISKLKRFDSMQLDTMQDLGGCRAVLARTSQVEALVALYESKPCISAEFVKKFDYIANPKPDGYRSVHLVYRYKSNHPDRSAHNRARIEIQLRSRLQHAWSTAVETIDTFTYQALKSGLGDPRWRRFFALMGSSMAFLENRPPVPDTIADSDSFVEELEGLRKELKVVNVLAGLAVGIEPVVKRQGGGNMYILSLDAKKERTAILGFPDVVSASAEYLRLEKKNALNPEIQTVMVSVDSVTQLKRAYPNYFLSTRDFIIAVENMSKVYRDMMKQRRAKARKRPKKQT